MNTSSFQIEIVDYAASYTELRAVRDAVFVVEQQVPEALERDALDSLSQHVIARDAAGQAIGTARLSADGIIGRMAIVAAWRGKQVGTALLNALLEQAKIKNLEAVQLHAQTHALDFYARHGFLPIGEVFVEAGIEHQQMRRRLDGAMRLVNLAQRTAATAAVIWRSRRQVLLYVRASDTALLAQPLVVQCLRRMATARAPRSIYVILHEADVQILPPPLFALIQRLPGVFQVRQLLTGDHPADMDSSISNEAGDSAAWNAESGSLALNTPALSRQQRELFQYAWEQAQACDALRVIGF